MKEDPEPRICDACWLKGEFSVTFPHDNHICRRCFAVSLVERIKENNGN